MKKILKICITLSFTFLLTGCVDCLVSLNYSKIKKPTLYGELTIEPQILEKYRMSISQKKKQLLSYAPVFLLKMPYLRGFLRPMTQRNGGVNALLQ